MIILCDSCGCNDNNPDTFKTQPNTTIELYKDIMDENNRIAHKNWHFFTEKGVLCINIMGSPGCGKTSLIEGIAKHIPPYEIAVIQGDLESDIDKQRLLKADIDTLQINTHSGCHLNAAMIQDSISKLQINGKKFLFIENVGNLVCPAGIKLGEHLNIVISSTPEGSDKPRKYPHIFYNADAIIISKIDLSEAVNFTKSDYIKSIRKINREAPIFMVSIKNTKSFQEVADFLVQKRSHIKNHCHKH